MACNANPSPDEIRTKLKSAMQNYLYKSVNNDSSKVKFRVEDVVYYDDVKGYDCEFHVKMTTVGVRDTVGVMRAQVSKDFTKVDRVF